MSGLITSTIKTNPMGRWYIEISDTAKPESIEICLDIEEYAKKIAVMGKDYDGKIEVAWSADGDVTPVQIHEVRRQMMAYEAEQEAIDNVTAENQAQSFES